MITTSAPTLTRWRAASVYLELHGDFHDSDVESSWLYYNSCSHIGVEQMAELFINNHACIKSSYDATYSPMPIEVFHAGDISGLLYSNGAVCVRQEDGLIELWIDKDTVRLFEYPKPEEIEHGTDAI